MTLLQKIQNLTWWTLDIKLKDILTLLNTKITEIENSPSGGTQDLQSVLDVYADATIIDNAFFVGADNSSNEQITSSITITPSMAEISGQTDNLTSSMSIQDGILYINISDSTDPSFNTTIYGDIPIASTALKFPAKLAGEYILATLDDIQAPLPTYADNATAIAGGLVVNNHYKTATGELRVVV